MDNKTFDGEFVGKLINSLSSTINSPDLAVTINILYTSFKKRLSVFEKYEDFYSGALSIIREIQGKNYQIISYKLGPYPDNTYHTYFDPGWTQILVLPETKIGEFIDGLSEENVECCFSFSKGHKTFVNCSTTIGEIKKSLDMCYGVESGYNYFMEHSTTIQITSDDENTEEIMLMIPPGTTAHILTTALRVCHNIIIAFVYKTKKITELVDAVQVC